MFRLVAALTLLTITVQLSAAEIPDRYWLRWRGPADSGSAALADCPVKWNQNESTSESLTCLALVVRRRSSGLSVVWGDHILLTSTLDGKDLALAYDWADKSLWSAKIGAEIPGKHRNGSGSNPSIVTDGDRVFDSFKSGNLVALDFVAIVLWQTNLQKEHAQVKLYWDQGTSPAITARDIVVAVMHGGDSYVAAFVQRTDTASNFWPRTRWAHAWSPPRVAGTVKLVSSTRKVAPFATSACGPNTAPMSNLYRTATWIARDARTSSGE